MPTKIRKEIWRSPYADGPALMCRPPKRRKIVWLTRKKKEKQKRGKNR